jgi:hypothetical protein
VFSAEKMAAQTMTVAAIAHIKQGVAAQEMSALIGGAATHRMPLFRALNTGLSTHEFNSMKPEKRLEVIRQSLDKMNPAVEAFTNSWEGIKTTAVDNVRQGIAAIGGPLFESVKDTVKTFNTWVGNPDNKGKLQGWGFALGQHLDNAFNHGVVMIQTWFPVIKTFGENLYAHVHDPFMKAEKIVARMVDSFGHFMMDPQALEKMMHIASQFAALYAGVRIMGAGSGLVGGIGGAGKALEGLKEVGIGVDALAVAGPTAAAMLALLAISGEGAVHALTDVTSQYHEAAKSLAADIGKNLKATSAEMEHLNNSTRDLRDAMGVGLLFIVDSAVVQFEGLLAAINGVIDGFINFGEGLKKILGFAANPDVLDETAASMDLARQQVKEDARLTFLGSYAPVKDMGAPGEAEKDRKIPHNVTHVHKVEIKVAPNPDPNRIAKRTAEIIGDLYKHPKIAALGGMPPIGGT